MKRYLTVEDINFRASFVADAILADENLAEPYRLYGVPRGGIPAAYAVAAKILRYGGKAVVTSELDSASAVIDDIEDSGKTRARYALRAIGHPFYPLVKRTPGDEAWYVFPWEGTEGQNDDDSAMDIPTRLLQYIGEDTTREGLRDTPKRFLKAWDEYTQGYKIDPASVLTTFADGAEKVDELVLVKDIPVYSHCEHHLAPFFGVAHVGYIPSGKVVGLSKLSRLVQVFAQRLQVQERLTQQVANALNDALAPVGVGVVIECRHMCMESRGVRTAGSLTVTSCLVGALKEVASARSEFLRLIR